jgi:hypothetical protein
MCPQIDLHFVGSKLEAEKRAETIYNPNLIKMFLCLWNHSKFANLKLSNKNVQKMDIHLFFTLLFVLQRGSRASNEIVL